MARDPERVLGKVEQTFQEIDIDKIERNPRQPRKTFQQESIIKLAKSLKDNGTIQPIVVRPNPEKQGWYIILAGERRWRAEKMNGKKRVICIVRTGDLKPFIASLIENYNREDINPVDAGESFKQAHDEDGMTWEELSQLTGLSVTTILGYVKVASPEFEPLHDLIREGKLPLTNAFRLRSVQEKYGVEGRKLIELAHRCIAGELPPEIVREDSPRKEAWIRARLPESATHLMKRILKIRYSAQSETLSLKAFLGCEEKDRDRILDGLPSSARLALRVQLRDLAVALLEFVDDAERHHNERVNPIGSSYSAISDPILYHAKKLAVYFLKGTTSGTVDLSQPNLAEVLGIPAHDTATLHTALSTALAYMQRQWRRPPSGTTEEVETIVLFYRLRHFSGCAKFGDFFKHIQKINSAPVPFALNFEITEEKE